MSNLSYEDRIKKHIDEIPIGTRIVPGNLVKKCKMINAHQISRYLCVHPDVIVIGKTTDRCNIYVKGGQ